MESEYRSDVVPDGNNEYQDPTRREYWLERCCIGESILEYNIRDCEIPENKHVEMFEGAINNMLAVYDISNIPDKRKYCQCVLLQAYQLVKFVKLYWVIDYRIYDLKPLLSIEEQNEINDWLQNISNRLDELIDDYDNLKCNQCKNDDCSYMECSGQCNFQLP
jgi:hypothetical protein